MRFDKQDSQVFLNTKMDFTLRSKLSSAVGSQNLSSHIWLMSSGTESQGEGIARNKLIALSYKGILMAAESVVKEFLITPKDVYLKALPDFHIGGISIYARSFISGCSIINTPDLSWEPNTYIKYLHKYNVSLSSMVPTQIYDLVKQRLEPPKSLRLVFVGGGVLNEALYQRAKTLGWPLVLTYGMTETSAMLAIKDRPNDGFQKLPHITEWVAAGDKRLSFSSESLLTGYLFVNEDGTSEFSDPKREGFYHSDDCGEFIDEKLHLLGRATEFVKIGGESVSLYKIQSLWDEQIGIESVIFANPDERLGFKLEVASVENITASQLEVFNHGRLPFERVHRIHHVSEFPRTALGKVNRNSLLKLIE